MADNITITQGSGTTVATDEAGGAQYQKVKLVDGTVDSTTVIAAGSGVAASAIRVELPTDGTGVISNITSSIKVHVLSTNGTMSVNVGKTDGTVTVRLDPGYTLGNVGVNNAAGASAVNIQDGGNSITIDGTVTGITNSIAVHVLSTGGTLQVRLAESSAGLHTDDTAFTPGTDVGVPVMGLFDDTATDSVDEGDAGILRMTGNRILMAHTDSTASIFTVSGSTSGVSPSGVTLVAPSANYSFKVFAFSLQTTGIVSCVARFTNGGGSATEFWRGLVTSNQTSSAPVGANLAVSPPSYLFATGTSTTLSLHLDTATLVHYSVSYFKESA